MLAFLSLHRARLRGSLVIGLILASALASRSVLGDEPVELAAPDGRIVLKLGAPSQGCPMTSLYDRKAGRELLAPDASFWTIELQHASGERIIVESGKCGSATLKRASPEATVVEWRLNRAVNVATTLPAAEIHAGLGSIFVRCTIHVEASEIRLKLIVQNGAIKWSIRQVHFPRISLLPLGTSDEDDLLVLPRASGTLVRRPIGAGVDYHQVYPEAWNTMQFCAYYDGDGGLYVANEDPLASVKTLHVSRGGSGNALDIRTEWPAEDMGSPANVFRQSGETVLRLFDGDWFDAARIYRGWATSQAKWWPALRNGKRPDTPPWFNDIAVWMLSSWEHTDTRQATESAIRFAKFMGVPTAVHWYNWHQVPFDNDYPHYFPVREGFAEGVKRLQQAGIRVMPYINGRLWDSDTKDFKTVALPAATKDEKGEFYIERYGSGEALVPMCPTTRLWQDKVQEIVLRLVGPEFNVDAVYIDQVAAAAPRLCFDRSHGHPLGGGHWWTTDGYWPMMQQLRFILSGKYPDKVLTTECNTEPFIHLFDGYLTWHFQLQDQIPLFAAVYGGTIQLFSRHYGGDDQLAHRMKIGQSLVFGEQLGWIAPSVIDQKETGEFLRAAARIRHQLRPFLAQGIMVRPPKVTGNIPEVTADWAWGGKSLVTTSALQSGAWQAVDGQIAFLFVNVSDQPISGQWLLDAESYGLNDRETHLFTWPDDGAPRTCRRPITLDLAIGARQIAVYILKG